MSTELDLLHKQFEDANNAFTGSSNCDWNVTLADKIRAIEQANVILRAKVAADKEIINQLKAEINFLKGNP